MTFSVRVGDLYRSTISGWIFIILSVDDNLVNVFGGFNDGGCNVARMTRSFLCESLVDGTYVKVA